MYSKLNELIDKYLAQTDEAIKRNTCLFCQYANNSCNSCVIPKHLCNDNEHDSIYYDMRMERQASMIYGKYVWTDKQITFIRKILLWNKEREVCET